MLHLLAGGDMTPVIGIVVGLVVALVVFGLVFLVSVLPSVKAEKKNQSASLPVAAAAESEEELAEEERAVEILEERIFAAQEEQPVVEQPAVGDVVEETPAEDGAEKNIAELSVIADATEEDGEEEDSELAESAEDAALRAAMIADAPEIQPSMRFDRSFKARLIQADGQTKQWYSDIKNAALSYERAKNSLAWKQEKFRSGRVALAKLIMRGKTLCLYLPITVGEIGNPSYKVEDVSGKAVNAATPTLLRIKNPRRAKQAKELIALVAEKASVKPASPQNEDYVAGLALQSTNALIEAGLIKIAQATPFDAINKN